MNKLYEIEGISNKKCTICNGFNKIYNSYNGECRFDIPQELGQGYLQQLSHSSQVHIIDFDIMLKKQTEIQYTSTKQHMDMLFCLGEDMQWELPKTSTEFEFLKGESFMGISKENKKHCIYPKNLNLKMMEIKLSLDLLEIHLIDIFGMFTSLKIKKQKQLFCKFNITPAINLILHQIKNCSYEKNLKKIYIDGKILELIATAFNEVVYQREGVDSRIQLSNLDTKSIYEAKKILDNNIEDTPVLSSLSKLVSLNEFKLKNGFKDIFGQPIHSYVIDKRLDLARCLLEENKLSVSEAARMVGYSNMSHFALAFRKKFGINPGEYSKKFKN